MNGMDLTNAARRVLPDWLRGFVNPDWWPDRPRNPLFQTINVLGILPGTNSPTTVEQIFHKRRDVLVWGGIAHVVDSATQASIFCPASGIWSQMLVAMRNPAGNVLYTDIGARVPLENIFSVWQNPGTRPVYWPMPIPIPKGGSLMLDIQSLAVASIDLRLTFLASIVHEETDRVVV